MIERKLEKERDSLIWICLRAMCTNSVGLSCLARFEIRRAYRCAVFIDFRQSYVIVFLNSCLIKAFNNFIFCFIYFDLKPLIFFSFNVGVVLIFFFLHCVLFILNNPCFNVMLMLWFSPPLQLYF